MGIHSLHLRRLCNVTVASPFLMPDVATLWAAPAPPCTQTTVCPWARTVGFFQVMWPRLVLCKAYVTRTCGNSRWGVHLLRCSMLTLRGTGTPRDPSSTQNKISNVSGLQRALERKCFGHESPSEFCGRRTVLNRSIVRSLSQLLCCAWYGRVYCGTIASVFTGFTCAYCR
jgi:hypothetical protein